MLGIGGGDLNAGVVSVHLLGEGNLGAKRKAEMVAEIMAVPQGPCAQAMRANCESALDATWAAQMGLV